MKQYITVPFLVVSFFLATNTRAQTDTTKTEKLSEVVVTGQYVPQSVLQSVYQVRIINRETIKMRNATDIQGVLNSELGIKFSNDMALGESDIQIMGMSGQNVKILLDGVPMIDRGSTRQSLSQIDIHSVERIEIVEGPMSVIYGTDALAGVINIITKRNTTGKDLLSIGASVQEETVGKEYDAFGKKGVHNENINLSWQKKGWSATGSITRNNSGGWQGKNTGRAKEWHPKDQWLGGGTVGYRKDNLNAWYRLDYLDESIHSLGNVNPNTFKATDAEYTTHRFTHQAQGNWKPSEKWVFNAAASYQNYTRTTLTTTLDTQTGDRRLSLGAGEQDESLFNSGFFRATSLYIPSDRVTVSLGTDLDVENASGARIEGKPSITNFAVFASSEMKPFKQLKIRPGVRLSKNSVYDAPPIIPSLNTKLELRDNMNLRLAYARGFRSPALRELYFVFFDANHSIEGNTNLKAEYSNSFNGSVDWRVVRESALTVTTNVAGFYNDFRNRIDIAMGVDPGRPNVSKYINVAHYKTTGGTWTNTIIWKKLQAALGFSYIGRYNRYYDDPTHNEDGELPQFVWAAEVNGNLMYHIEKIGLDLGLFYKYTGRLPRYEIDNDDNVKLTRTGAYHWMDFNAGKTLNQYLILHAGVKNIFGVTDVKSTSGGSGNAHSTIGPVPVGYGRSYFLGIAFQFDKK